MENLYKNRVQQNRKIIVENLDPEDIVKRLITTGCINRQQRDRLKKELEKGFYYHNELLLDFLLKDPKPNTLDHFLAALEATNQTRLAGLIKHDISPHGTLSSEDKRKIQSHFDQLVTMDTSEIVMYLHEMDKKYFSLFEYQDLQGMKGDVKKAQHLLTEVIMKGTYRHLAGLRDALVKTGQANLADCLPSTSVPSQSQELQQKISMTCRVDAKSNTQGIRQELITKLMDPAQDLHRKLATQYHLTKIIAEANPSTFETFTLTLSPKHVTKMASLKAEVNNGHLEKVIVQYARIKGTWSLVLTAQTEEEVMSFNLQHEGQEAEASLRHENVYRDQVDCPLKQINKKVDSEIEHRFEEKQLDSNKGKDSGRRRRGSGKQNLTATTEKPSSIKPATGRAKTQKSAAEKEAEAPLTLEKITTKAFKLINEKDHMPFDLHQLLVRVKKNNRDIVPTDIKNDQVLNMLQQCLEKGRLNFFPVFVHLGWWRILATEKVHDSSTSEYKGKTAKQISEIKRAKKPLSEFNFTNEWDSSLSTLMKACKNGDKAKVKALLPESGQDAYVCDFNNGNALYWAVVNGDAEVVELLLEAGVEPNFRTKKGENLLHVACSVGNSHLIALLLGQSIDPHLEDNSHKSAIEKTAENGDITSLQQFIAKGITVKDSCVSLSAFCGRLEYLKFVLDDRRMDINAKDLYSRTALHRAVEGNKVDIVRFLIERGANIELVTCSQRNLLHIAAESGNIDILYSVISAYRRAKVVERMIDAKDRYNGVELCFLIRGRDKGRDAWHYVEVKRYMVPVFLIKTKTGNVDVANFGKVLLSGWGVNPSQDSIEEIEELFKERRLDENASSDMTPLHIALFKGHTEVAKVLVDVGCKVNAIDSFGNTPLMIAASKGNLTMINLLESKGATFTDTNIDGKTVENIAEINDQQEVLNNVKGQGFNGFIKTFREETLAKVERKVSRQNLNSVQRKGKDMKNQIIDSLRELRQDIDKFLVEIGPGPAMEASDNDAPPPIRSKYPHSADGNTLHPVTTSLSTINGNTLHPVSTSLSTLA